jgi:hypothetical protein
MCDTKIADEAIQKLIVKLSESFGRALTDDDAVIERIAKLRASMNPTVIHQGN